MYQKEKPYLSDGNLCKAKQSRGGSQGYSSTTPKYNRVTVCCLYYLPSSCKFFEWQWFLWASPCWQSGQSKLPIHQPWQTDLRTDWLTDGRHWHLSADTTTPENANDHEDPASQSPSECMSEREPLFMTEIPVQDVRDLAYAYAVTAFIHPHYIHVFSFIHQKVLTNWVKFLWILYTRLEMGLSRFVQNPLSHPV